eukprot:m.59423 g.59423  ORF g.59423 m.59423 type:complete len:229 (+) comp9464_c0_seq2:206-892(+)
MTAAGGSGDGPVRMAIAEGRRLDSPGGEPASGPEVAVTERMASEATNALKSGTLPSASKHRLEQVNWVAGERAPFSAVKLLVAAARATGSTVYLHELMTGSRIVVDSPAARTSNPEMVARRKKLQAAMDEKDYQRKYGRFDAPRGKSAQFVAPLDVQEGRKVFALVIQLLLTMATCFAAGWYFVGHFLVDDAAMMALGGVAFMVTAIGAELYFLMKTSILKPKLLSEE